MDKYIYLPKPGKRPLRTYLIRHPPISLNFDEMSTSLRFRRTYTDELHSMLANLQHLNLTSQIQYDSPVLKAHGGYCDVFEGRYLRYGECIYKVAIKRLRVHIKSDRDFAKASTFPHITTIVAEVCISIS